MGNQLNTQNNNCCTPTGKYEICGCVGGIPYVQLTVVGGGLVQTAWLNTETGDTFTTKPVGFLTGDCVSNAQTLFTGTGTDPNVTDVTGGATSRDNMSYLELDGSGNVLSLWKYDLETAKWYKIKNGQDIAALISTDAGNQLVVGTDGKLFAKKQSVDVNLTPITYVPTATGNTANLGQIVVDPDGFVWAIDLEGDAVQLSMQTGAPVTVGTTAPTGTAIEGAIHLVTDDGQPTGTVLEQYIYDTDSGVWIEMQRNAQDTLKFSTTAPVSNGEWDGEEFFVTSDGTSAGAVLEQWVWDKQSTTWIKRPASKPLDALTSTQPTPTATGNTTNLNTIFKDAAGDSWFVDSDGDATKLGSASQAASILWESVTTNPTATGNTGTLPRFTYNTTTGDKYFVDSNGVAELIEAGSTIGDIVYVDTTGPSTATIFSLDNPPVTNDPALAGVAGNVYIGTDGSVWSYNGTTYVTKTFAFQGASDEFTATAGQTSFTLTGTPKGKVWMFRNGARLPNASFSVVGTTVTYVPANNGSAALGSLVAGDIIDIDYVK